MKEFGFQSNKSEKIRFFLRKSNFLLLSGLFGFFLILAGASAQADEFAKHWDLPGWSGVTVGSSDGNPYMDSDSNIWGAYGVQFTGTGYTDWSNYSLMTWITNWDGTWTASLYGNVPRYYSTSSMLMGNSTDTIHNGGALVFIPAITGSYSMYGKYYCVDVDGATPKGETHIVIGKMDASNTWTELYSEDVEHMGYTADLSSVSALQNITLTASDKLIVVVWGDMDYHTGYAASRGVGIGYNRLVYDRNFENLSTGSAGSNVVIDNTWTGDTPPTYNIVETLTEQGQALEVANISNFAQMYLTQYPSTGSTYTTVTSGKKYRIIGTCCSMPPMNVKILLRKSLYPYISYATVNMTSDETWRSFDYVVTGGNGGGTDARIMLSSYNSGNLYLGDLKIVEYPDTWEPAPQDPPIEGNMVQNSSFELGKDGWTVCRGTATMDDTTASSGRRSLCLEGSPILSSPCYPIGLGQSYTLSASIKADYAGASVLLKIAGSSVKYQSFSVPQNAWGTIEFTDTLEFPVGTNCQNPYATVWIASSIPEGSHIWIDDIDLHYGNTSTYSPAYTMESSLSTNYSHNLVITGEPVTLNIENIEWTTTTDPLTVNVDCEDESGTVVNTWSVSAPVLSGYEPSGAVLRTATLNIGTLAPGYWKFVTRTNQSNSAEGEVLVSCVPDLPAVTSIPYDWQAGTHARTYARIEAPDFSDTLYEHNPIFGARWTRLHDIGGMPKWNYVEQQQGVWDWSDADDTVDNFLAAGYRVLGVLDGVPGWRMTNGVSSTTAMAYPDSDFTDWKNYVSAAITHFQGKIDTWEVINEPNFSGTPERYVEMLEHAYDAAKNVDPSITIIGGGGAILPIANHTWTTGAITAGLFSHCDAVSYHGYGNATTRLLAGPQPLFDFMNWINGQMNAKIGEVLPVWDTEVGVSPGTASSKFWLPNRAVSDPYKDARQLIVTLLSERAADVKKTFFYAAFPYCLAESISYYMFSDINSQLTPLTTSLGVAMDTVNAMETDGVEYPATDTVMLKFRTPQGETPHQDVYCIWTLQNTTPVTLQIPDGVLEVTAKDMYGRDITFSHQSGSVSLDASPTPSYITLVYKQWDQPGWSGVTVGSSDGNPYTDSDNNTWGAYGVQFTGTGYTDWSNYSLMTWITNWDGTWTASLYGNMPRYYSTSSMLMGNSTDTLHNGGALVFIPAVTGSYSMYGKYYCVDVDGATPKGETHIVIGKMDASNTWTELYSTDVEHMGYTVDLSSISALQNITLTNTDKLIVVVWGDMDYHTGYAASRGVGIRL